MAPLNGSAFQTIDYGDYNMSFEELLKFNKLSAHEWISENMTKEDKIVNINNINGVITMSFSMVRERNLNDKQKKPYRKFRYIVGGTKHEMNFTIIGDSIHFHGFKGWNDCKIIELKKDRLVLEQLYQNKIIRWNMIPMTRKKED